MINNKKYWQNRANSRMAAYHRNSDETIFKMNRAYNRAISDINADIKNIFKNYQINTGLSAEECRKILNSKISNKELVGIKERIKYIKDDDIKKQLYAELNSKAYKARITRLEALKDSININTKRVADTELEATTRLYTNNIKEAYYRTMFDIQKGTGIGFNFANMSDRQVEEILKNNWSGEHYSKRIWNNSNVFASKLEETLLNGLMTGHSISKIAKELEQYTSYGRFATERLARTEMTYMCNMAEIECYKEDDIEEYVFLATLDLRTSKQCRQHDGNKYKTSEARPGYNLPPLHAYCRSTTIPYMGKEWYENLTRRARDPETNKSYIIPKNMNYEEWYQKYVVNKYGTDKTKAMENMINNKTSDKIQFKKYRNVLGKESPKSLKEFQELKYNNSNEWRLIKGYYKGITKGSLSTLVDYKLYKQTDKLISDKLIGLKIGEGIKIKSHSIHFIERVIGSVEQKRSGVMISDIKNTLINPIKIGKVRVVDGNKSIKFYGNNNMVTINPDTGNLIQVNPRKKVE